MLGVAAARGVWEHHRGSTAATIHIPVSLDEAGESFTFTIPSFHTSPLLHQKRCIGSCERPYDLNLADRRYSTLPERRGIAGRGGVTS
ncbi:hypothetical protein E2C01_009989 [Portunus trituberculatus]|uniref:Uncharacterized protein n=1 Tax=Portunus trituberculatus TaxID=210409 RepID=A0A5B7D7G8_PORTR|nr:hypothetical protein [Portunus trituberculatus]